MQIVYISDRPEILLGTLTAVSRMMPWVDRAVVAAPRSVHGRLAESPIKLDLVDDEEITGRALSELHALDHSSLNIVLRQALVRDGPVDDVFIQSDDDYRPLRPVAESDFVDDGRLHAYYCHDLDRWPGLDTPHDWCLHTTASALRQLGCGRLNFASHMPQAYERSGWLESFDAVAELTGDRRLCEWSIPANYGLARHRDRFHPPRPYQTLAWPQFPTEWTPVVTPSPLAFENYYPDHYLPGHLFAGLPDVAGDDWPATGFEKIRRYDAFAVQAEALRFPVDVANPWTNTAARRMAFATLARIRQVAQYVGIAPRR